MSPRTRVKLGMRLLQVTAKIPAWVFGRDMICGFFFAYIMINAMSTNGSRKS
jgi:hypothetical protein